MSMPIDEALRAALEQHNGRVRWIRFTERVAALAGVDELGSIREIAAAFHRAVARGEMHERRGPKGRRTGIIERGPETTPEPDSGCATGW